MATYLKLIICILFPFVVALTMPANEPEIFPQEDSFDLNSDRLDGRFTGGFGEQTCHSCHFDYELNMDGGSLTIDGLPDNYQPGDTYDVTIAVKSEHLENGGFQMTARFEDGSQAGRFTWSGENLRFTPGISDEVQYLQHAEAGTRPTANREVSWNFNWQAPEARNGSIIFNIAANAGNNDDSAFGDWIYVKELESAQAEG